MAGRGRPGCAAAAHGVGMVSDRPGARCLAISGLLYRPRTLLLAVTDEFPMNLPNVAKKSGELLYHERW
jgi:hypothetical protein